MTTKYKHQPKSYPATTTINVDTNVTGKGGVAVQLGKVDALASERAWHRAASETQDHGERVVLAYQYLSEETSGNVKQNEDFSLEPDMSIPYTTKGQAANLERKPKAAEAPKPKKKKRKVPDADQQIRRLQRELEELRDTRRTKPLESIGQDFEEEIRRLDEEAKYQQAAQREMERAAFKNIVVKTPDVKKFTEQEAVAAIKQGFASLGIPNLTHQANKPTFRVQFDLGSIGKQEAWYHWVSEHSGGLFLVYDTRFEYGIRYSPPNLGPQQTITVNLPDHGKSYQVYSIDFTHPFGVFSITNLMLVEKTPIPSDAAYGRDLMSTMNSMDDLTTDDLPLPKLGVLNDDDGEEWRDPRGFYASGD